MIIYPNQGAGMCNRLFAAAHIIACSEVSGNPAYICSLKGFGDYFEGLPLNRFYYHRPEKNRKISSLFRPITIVRSGRFSVNQPIPFNHPQIQRALHAGITILFGWRFRDDDAMQKYGLLVRTIFTPRKHHQAAIDQTVYSVRERCEILVGVHIRQTDYKQFLNGKYYYPVETYRNWMHYIQNGIPQKIGFLVASDVKLKQEDFLGLPVTFAPYHPLQDLYALAACDSIIGPPSTYSAWAAYYGYASLWHAEKANEMPNLELIKKK